MKKISCLLTLVLMLVPVAQLAAQTQKNAESAKKNIARLGVGKKAKTTITLNDRSKVKGYVYSVGDDDFVVRDSKTDSPTTVRYADVLSVNDRSSKDLLIGFGAAAAGAAILILVVTRGAALRPH